LAHFLLHSLEPEEEDLAAAWDLEIARRVDEIQSGRAAGTPAEEVFAELRRDGLRSDRLSPGTRPGRVSPCQRSA
jgi:putative addiction module component (TIGR02574 family)